MKFLPLKVPQLANPLAALNVIKKPLSKKKKSTPKPPPPFRILIKYDWPS
jgi:hypothetical protein